MLAALVAAAVVVPATALAWLQFAPDDSLPALSATSLPLLTSATARTARP